MSADPYRIPGILGRLFRPIQEMSIVRLCWFAAILIVTVFSLGKSAEGIIRAIKEPPQVSSPAGPVEEPCYDTVAGIGLGSETCAHPMQVGSIHGGWFRCTCPRPGATDAGSTAPAKDGDP